MKRLVTLASILVFAAFVLAYCIPAAAPEATPGMIPTKNPFITFAYTPTPTRTPSPTPTRRVAEKKLASVTPTKLNVPTATPSSEKVFAPPTLVVGNAEGVLSGEIQSIMYFSAEYEAYLCLESRCEYEFLIDGKDGRPNNIAFVMYYDDYHDDYYVAQVLGTPTQIWVKDDRVLVCTTCQGSFVYMKSVSFDDMIKSLRAKGDTNAVKMLRFWRDAAEDFHACFTPYEQYSKADYCARSLPAPTSTPTGN